VLSADNCYLALGSGPAGSVLLIITLCGNGDSMTAVEVLFRYGTPPSEQQMAALGLTSDVYGVRRIQFNEPERTIRIEYDATRLNDAMIEKLLRSAGFDIRERLALV